MPVLNPPPRLSRKKQMTILAETVNKVGPGPYQLIVLILGGGIYMAEGCLLLVISLAAKDMANYWEVNPLAAGVLASIVFVGLCVGTMVGGAVCDNYGRKGPITITYLGIIIFLALCLVSPSIPPLLFAQFMLGFFLGFGLPAANAIVCESCPASHRPNIYSLTMILFSLGQVYAALMIWVFNPELREEKMGWRGMLAIGLLPPGVLVVNAHLFLLESPHFLLAYERFPEARSVIIRIAKYNHTDTGDIEFALSSIDEADNGSPSHTTAPRNGENTPLMLEDEDANDNETLWRFKVLFTRKWRCITLIMCFITFTSNFVYFGMIYALPHSLKEMPVTVSGEEMSPAGAVFISAIFEIPGVFVAILLGNTLGRRTNISVAFLATALCLIGTVYSIFVGHMTATGLWCTFGVKMFIASGFIIIYLSLLETYPTMFRATGLAFCMVVGRVGAFFCPFTHDILQMLEVHAGWFFLVMEVMLVLGATIVWCLPYEVGGLANLE